MIFSQAAGDRKVRVFSLSPAFLAEFHDKQPDWGPVGYFTFKRTYSRPLPDGGTEEWWQTCKRVVEGCFQIQKIHCRRMALPWNESKARNSAQEMFRRMFEFKFTPPGRGLWMMGTDVVYTRGSAALQNCSFVSSDKLAEDFSGPFIFLMDLSMLGVGVGGDTRGSGSVRIQRPDRTVKPYVVEDTREGWVDLIRTLLESFVGKALYPQVINYSGVRGRGVPIKTFGGVASGPFPLQNLVEGITKILMPKGVTAKFDCDYDETTGKIGLVSVKFKGKKDPTPYRIGSAQIVDVFNFIGKCVVAGGLRRTAEIMFGEPDDEEFVTLKQDEEALNDRRWASNNSVFGYVGMDYSSIVESIAKNGEPGICWLENARQFSRMGRAPDSKDWRVMGTNPCFAGGTLVAVADGRGAVPIHQLAEEGFDVPVYSVREDGKVEIQMGRNPRMTHSEAPLVEVVLDDGTTIRVTPDHKMRLLEGTEVEAQHLRPGDSLPRLTKRLEDVRKGQKYLRMYGDTLDTSKNKVFEHRLIARFHDSDTWSQFDEAKQSGWLKGGLVVHHKDFDRTNNRPENLCIMSFKEHQALHARLADRSGEKNPMWGRTHSALTRAKIGRKTKEQCNDPAFLAKLAASHTQAERAEASQRMSEQRRGELFSYYKEQEAATDLETVWMENRLYAVKVCESCDEKFVVPWRTREQAFCSCSCSNRKSESIQARKKGQCQFFAARQRQVLHDQVMAFKDLQDELGRDPKKSEWVAVAKGRGLPTHFRTKGTTTNPHALCGFFHLREVAVGYNHRVVKVREVGSEPVFNITVDQNHTVGVVTRFDEDTLECHGIFTFQCGEMSLESFELCNLVETYPARHDSYDDYERSLKMAYLYAKTVTLVPTHIPRANAVMQRNRRIGCSMSGITQAMAKLGRRTFLQWCGDGYEYIQRLDRIYSEWLGCGLSIKTTTVKPSGTVSLLCGAAPGIHYPHSEFYIRHIRVQNTSPLVQAARDAGYDVHPDPYADDTSVVAFPVREKHFTKGKAEVTVWEQFVNVADMQKHWADNQVSCLTGDTLIRTSVGTIPMGHLAREMGLGGMHGVHPYHGPLRVLDANNEWSSVSALVINSPRTVLRVNLEGGQHLTGTPDHEVQIVAPDLSFVWRPLSELRSGDHVVEVINQKTSPSSHQILQRRLGGYSYPGRSDADRICVPTRMTPALAEFLGYMVSDGWVQNSTGKVFGLSQKANNVADHYVELVKDLFGLDVRSSPDGRQRSDIPLLSLSSNSTKVAHWLRWVGLYSDDGFKKVPWPILMAGPRSIKAFLKGVTLDGHMSTTNGRIVIMTTNSTVLADELCVLLKQIGFQPVKTLVQSGGHEMVSPTNGVIYECGPAWEVSVSAGQSSRFMRMIGFAEEHKNDAYDQYGDKTRRHVFGCAPDFGLRVRMQEMSRACSSRLLKDHWHSRGQHKDKRVSRETLLQMVDVGEYIPAHLLRPDLTFRKVLGVEQVAEDVTFDLTVEGSHSYVANGFASHNCTVTFSKVEVRDIQPALEAFEDRLKGISMLPLQDGDHGYKFAPYQAITGEQYDAMVARVSPIDFGGTDTHDHDSEDKFCTGDSCVLR